MFVRDDDKYNDIIRNYIENIQCFYHIYFTSTAVLLFMFIIYTSEINMVFTKNH